jgi:hypothetical protein
MNNKHQKKFVKGSYDTVHFFIFIYHIIVYTRKMESKRIMWKTNVTL